MQDWGKKMAWTSMFAGPPVGEDLEFAIFCRLWYIMRYGLCI
jgi:hypothetical protein